jgi:hypothetical protein
MNRRGWVIFVAVQAVGEASLWSAPHIWSSAGPALWVAGFLLLLPGTAGSSLIVEKLLWNSGLTLLQLTILQVPLEVAFNAGAWLLCAKAYKSLRSRRPSRSTVSGSTDPKPSHPSTST